MADLTRSYHWERFAPNIGNNLELRPVDRIYIEVAVGLTVMELVEFHGSLAAIRDMPRQDVRAVLAGADVFDVQLRPAADVLAAKWARFVRLVGTHSIEGRPLATLSDYLTRALSSPGIFHVIELLEKVDYLNSVRGSRELFSDAPSGGSSSTEETSTEPAESQAAAP